MSDLHLIIEARLSPHKFGLDFSAEVSPEEAHINNFRVIGRRPR